MPHEVLAFGLGLVIALAVSGLLRITPGGFVVPGYLSLYLLAPQNVAFILAVSLLTFAAVRFISGWTLLYGARRFVVCLLVGFLFLSSRYWAGQHIAGLDTTGTFGFVVPGLLASWMDQQGVLPTLASLSFVTVLVGLGMVVIRGGLLV